MLDNEKNDYAGLSRVAAYICKRLSFSVCQLLLLTGRRTLEPAVDLSILRCHLD